MTIEGPLTNIAKPAIVELLRLFDENQWVVPRIRYASVQQARVDRGHPAALPGLYPGRDGSPASEPLQASLVGAGSSNLVRPGSAPLVCSGPAAASGPGSEGTSEISDPAEALHSEVPRLALQTKRAWRRCRVSRTRHWCSSKFPRAQRAICARWVNSHVSICRSPVIGSE